MVATLVGSSAWTAVSGTTVGTLNFPAGTVETNLGLIFYAIKPETLTPTIIQSGWTHLGAAESAVIGAIQGADTGNLEVGCFWKVIGASEPTPQIQGSVGTSPLQAVVKVWQKDAGDEWVTPTGSGDGQTAASTSFSTGAVVSTLAVDDVLAAIIGVAGNCTISAQAMALTGITFSASTVSPAANSDTAVGNDGAATAFHRTVTDGSASGGVNVTATLTTARYGAAYVVRIRTSNSGGGAQALSAVGNIATAESVGTPSLASIIGVSPTGIVSAESVGQPTLGLGAVQLSPTGIGTSESVGTPTLTSTIAVSPVGIGTSEAVGQPTLTSTIAISPSGIISAEAVGSPTLSSVIGIAPEGISSAELVGVPSLAIIAATIVISPPGIGYPTETTRKKLIYLFDD